MAQNLTLHPAFEAPLNYAQFAKDGVWEKAWKFNAINIPGTEDIKKYLDEAEEVAFEVFVGDAFFGVRFRGAAESVVVRALACVAAYQASTSGSEFFSALSKQFETRAWGDNISFAEVGAVNFWKSVGPFRLPDWQNATDDFASVWQELLATPVGRNTQHPRALELGCDGQFPHWFGLPISDQTPPFALSERLFKAALAQA